MQQRLISVAPNMATCTATCTATPKHQLRSQKNPEYKSIICRPLTQMSTHNSLVLDQTRFLYNSCTPKLMRSQNAGKIKHRAPLRGNTDTSNDQGKNVARLDWTVTFVTKLHLTFCTFAGNVFLNKVQSCSSYMKTATQTHRTC